MTALGIIALCALTLAWILWPVVRPGAVPPTGRGRPGLPLEDLEAAPRERERHERRSEAE